MCYCIESIAYILLIKLPALCQDSSQDDRWGKLSIEGGDLLSSGQKGPWPVYPRIDGPGDVFSRIGGPGGL